MLGRVFGVLLVPYCTCQAPQDLAAIISPFVGDQSCRTTQDPTPVTAQRVRFQLLQEQAE